MAMMEALLKIKASVTGGGAVDALGKSLGGLQGTADRVSSGISGLGKSVGGLSGALTSLVPLLSGAGLAALGHNAINAADDMNDMAQKTGVSVENLSRFAKAAEMSGTTIEGVGASMIKLNRNIATGNKATAAALRSLGISATDASGKLKSADQIMFEVADKFAAMPDGARKSAAAMALFGKAGADMIPLLNGGSKSIQELSATMTGEFASAADELNDKIATIQQKLGDVGVEVGTALMPMINGLADGIVNISKAFADMPGWLQTTTVAFAALVIAIGPLTGIVNGTIAVFQALAALKLGATIAGWLGLLGPAMAAAQAVLAGFLGWLTTTLLPALVAFFSGPVGWTVLAVAAVVAMVIAFREPIGNFLVWLGTALQEGLKAALALAHAVFVQPFIDLWNNVLRAPITAMWEWVKGVTTWALQAIYAVLWQLLVQPFINLWEVVLREPVTAMWEWLKEQWTNLSEFWSENVIKPLGDAWNGFTKAVGDRMTAAWDNVKKVWAAFAKFWDDTVVKPVQVAWDGLTKGIQSAMQQAANFVDGVWKGIIGTLRAAFNGFISGLIKPINDVIRGVNVLLGQFNKLPGPDIGLVNQLPVPQFASGGYVTRPTLGMIGEGGQPEYIIPESQMGAASANYLEGRRGRSVLNDRRRSRSMAPMRQRLAERRGDQPVSIAIQTGPVMDFDGRNWVTVDDLEKAMRVTADGVMSRLRTPASRQSLGIRRR